MIQRMHKGIRKLGTGWLLVAVLGFLFSESLYALQGNVYVLNGSSRDAFTAEINGITVKTATVQAIDDSIASMIPGATEILSQSPAGSYAVDVTVNATQTRPIHPLFFGFNLSDMAFGYTETEFVKRLRDPRYAALLSKLRPGLIRYPGGSFGEILWDRSNTQSPISPNQVLRAQDLDDLVVLCRKTGATLYIQIPLTPGGENNWADFAAYCNEKSYSDVVYISSGNENHIWLGGDWSADTYVANFKKYYDAMTALRPGLIFGLPEACNVGGPSVFDKAWVDPILQKLAAANYKAGLVTSHLYHFYGGFDNTLDNLLQNMGVYSSATADLVASRNQYNPNALAMWTEFGPTVGVPDRRIFNSVGTALWGADAIGRVARAGADGVLFYRLSCPKDFAWPSAAFASDLSEVYPLTLTYLMFGQWWGKDWVLNVNSTDDSRLSVNASTDNDHVYVMLINKTASQDLLTRVTVTASNRSYYLSRSCPAHSITLVSFTKQEHAPSKLVVTASPKILLSDGKSTSLVTAKVMDDLNNVITTSSATVVFSLSGSAGGSLSATNVPASNGVATVTFSGGTSPGKTSVTATSPGLTSGVTELTLVMNNAPTSPSNLLCNGLVNPTGVKTYHPDFSWAFNDPGDTESAFRILVADSQASIDNNAGNVWDSGKKSLGGTTVKYEGSRLKPGITYYWKVITWDSYDVQGAVSNAALFSTSNALENHALRFNETDTDWLHSVFVRYNSSLDINAGNSTGLTVEMWVNRTDMLTNAAAYFSRFADGNTGYWMGIDNAQKVTMVIGNSRQVYTQTSSVDLSSGAWHHLAWVIQKSNNQGRIFIDGVDRTANPGATVPMPTSVPYYNAYIGYNIIDSRTHAMIDEIRVSNAARYTSNFKPPAGPFIPDANTKGLWHLDEGSGEVTYDASGNGNTGTFIGNPVPVWVTGYPTESTGPSISVTSPDGGEIWGVNSTQTITWTSSGSLENVNVEFSTDGGQGWTKVASNISNSGSYGWTVSNTPSTTCRIRITDVGGTVSDSSDGNFTITNGCTYSLSSATVHFDGSGGTGDLKVTSGSSCSWTAVSNSAWISLTSSGSGSGNGIVSYSVDTNGSTSLRTGTLTVAGQTFTIIQAGIGGNTATTLFVPVLLSLSGAGGSFYSTELTFTNRGTTTAQMEFEYVAAFSTGSGTASTILPPGQMIVSDSISYLKSLGIQIPESGNRGGTLRVSFSDLSSPSAASINARTTTLVKSSDGNLLGRAGLAYPAIPVSTALNAPVYICGLRQNATDRSNVAFQNMGTTGDGNITLRATVFDGSSSFSKVLPSIVLEPGAFNQIGGVLASNGLSLTNGYVKVERTNGTASYYAYGVINDQANSDGSLVIPKSANTAPVAGLTLPVIVQTSTFLSELVLTNFSNQARNVNFTFVADAVTTADKTAHFTINLPAGQQQIIPDIFAYMRDKSVEGIGPAGTTAAGALFATAAGGDLSGVVLGARTSASGDSAGGRFGLFYTAVPYGQASIDSAWVFSLQQNSENRTNLAIVNTGEIDTSDDIFAIDLYDGETSTIVKTLNSVVVRAHGWIQIGTILNNASGVQHGYAEIRRTSGNNPFITYAVINDGASPGLRTGDGAYISSTRE